MTYGLYNLITDLTEAGYTIEFKPFFSDRPYPLEFIIVVIKMDDMKASRHIHPQDLVEAEDGQTMLITQMIEMVKYLIRQSQIERMKEEAQQDGSNVEK